MEQMLVIIPILAAVVWYSFFSRIPFSRFVKRSAAFDILASLGNSKSEKILARGSISRFELWSLKRAHDRHILRQLGIGSFDQIAGMVAEPIDPQQKISIRRKA